MTFIILCIQEKFLDVEAQQHMISIKKMVYEQREIGMTRWRY